MSKPSPPQKMGKNINKKIGRVDAVGPTHQPSCCFALQGLSASLREIHGDRDHLSCRARNQPLLCFFNAKWNTKVFDFSDSFRVRKPWIWVSTTSEERWQQYSSLVLPEVRLACLSCESPLPRTILRHLAKVKSRQKEGSHRLDETIRHELASFSTLSERILFVILCHTQTWKTKKWCRTNTSFSHWVNTFSH